MNLYSAELVEHVSKEHSTTLFHKTSLKYEAILLLLTQPQFIFIQQLLYV